MDAFEFETALSGHQAANPEFARVYDEYIDDKLRNVSTWPEDHRWGLLQPPSDDLILFLLQNGVSPSHLAELISAYSEANLPIASRQYLQMLLFSYEPAFCIGDGVVKYAAADSFTPISACTCVPCAVAAGCDEGDSKGHVDATRRQIERRFKLEKRAFDMHMGGVRRLNGRPLA